MARNFGLRYTEDIVKAVQLGMSVAREVSRRAGEALRLGGLTTEEGKKAVLELDKYLRKGGINPGTTADLTASSLLVAILTGFRF